MNTRRLVLHLIVGLLTFLIGLTAAMAFGGFDPLAVLTRHSSRHQFTIPPQSITEYGRSYESYGGCRKARARTAELPYQVEPLTPQVAPDDAFDSFDAPPPPPKAPRYRH
ncbi:MAG TPA: hypothetical protein VGC89_12395 [Pyrinomonadaceae bacterium]|jgi:hypothetical protein